MSETPCNLDRSVRLLQDIYANEHVKEILNRHQELLSEASRIARENQRSHSITDKPFEIFWRNPSETSHSRLLAYFLNPQESHGFGKELLGLFYNRFGLKYLPIDDDTIVTCEMYAPNEDSRGFIDILIQGGKDSSKHAVVIENKVNNAADQQNQLSRYYKWLKMNMGYKDEDIHIIYLPLRCRDPHPPAVEGVPKDCLHKCSYDKEIRGWLKAAIKKIPNNKDSVQRGMRNNLRHYLHLLNYLIETDKEIYMKEQILKHLEKHGQANCNNTHQLYKEMNTLNTATQGIRDCLQAVLRGKMLTDIYKKLKSEYPNLAYNLSYYDQSGCKVKDQEISPFNPCFLEEYKVGIKLEDNCVLCVAVSADYIDRLCWFGIMQRPSPIPADHYTSLLNEYEPQSNEHWLAWWYVEAITYDNCACPEQHKKLVADFMKVYNICMSNNKVL